jgi:hypothetical protein
MMCLVVACVVAGCTPDPPNDGRSTSTTPTSPATTTPSFTMPPVTSLPPEPPPVIRPLDASRYTTADTVCGLLTDVQASELGLLSSTDSSSIGGGSLLTCRRKGSGTKRDLEFYLWPDGDPLVGEFGRPPDSDDRYFVDIVGQPAVVIGNDPEPACRVVVGLAARQGLEIMTNDDDDNACALAVAIAEQMVRNLGG